MRRCDFNVHTINPDLPVNHIRIIAHPFSEPNVCGWFIYCTNRINYVTNTGNEFDLVNFHELIIHFEVEIVVHHKVKLSNEIPAGALAYWRRYCRRKYQHAIAQALQRELDLPGEIAEVISKLA
jgi:hypothetical protein